MFEAEHRIDWCLGALGSAFGAVSLALPFGRDQGLYYFVGREWLQHGEMPYRDAFEQKTPAIFFTHALAIAVFGDHMWSIRLLELICLLALGLVCARLATPGGEAVPRGLYGASVLAAMVLYVGFFDFWSTAQCEIWCTTAALASACAAARMRSARSGAIVGGLLAGVALLFKPPSLPLVALAGVACLGRARQEARPTAGAQLAAMSRSALLFGGAAAGSGALVVAYFAVKGALPAMADVLIGANGYYVRHEPGVHSVSDVFQRTLAVYKLWEPVSALLLESVVAGCLVGLVRRDRALRDRHVFALLCCVAAFLGVLSQLKFYMYHWGLVVGPATLVAANVALDVAMLLRWRMPERGAAVAPVLFAANLLLAYALTGRAAGDWFDEATASLEYAGGRIGREEFSRKFAVDSLKFSSHDAEQVAIWLRDHTSPEDEVAVRGFEPEIYAAAHRRYGGRFFWTSFLTDPHRAYRRAEWLEDDRKELAERSPRWIVALSWVHEGPDAPEYFEPLGYVTRQEMYGFAIMEKANAVGAR